MSLKSPEPTDGLSKYRSVRGRLSWAELLASLNESEQREAIQSLSEAEAAALQYDWQFWARPNQLPPPGDWRFWLLQAGRGFGKTKTGAETIRSWVAQHPEPIIIHLVAPTAADARDVMVEGPAGLLSCYPDSERPSYEPSKRVVTWRNGTVAHAFSAEEPERLRGPQCGYFWADEAAAWKYPEDTWDNLMFGFRLGSNPRGVITTTPKPIKLIRDIISNPHTVVTRGTSYENRANLAPAFFDSIIRKYEGTRLGRQELMAELLEDLPGALWTRSMIERSRFTGRVLPDFARVVVAIDPAVTAGEESDETGIVVVALGTDAHVYVLGDYSLRGSPGEWAEAAARAWCNHRCDRIVAEVNNGGDLVEGNLRGFVDAKMGRGAGLALPFRAVRASRGKLVRAEPVAALYEQNRVHHVGSFDKLEDQMCMYIPGQDDTKTTTRKDSTGQVKLVSRSPDRMDALVWAIYDLVIQPAEEQMRVQYSEPYQISPY